MGGAGGRAETKYRFEVSADWNPIGKLWISPVDVADGYSVKDAERLATGAADWTTSHRSRTPYQGTDWADTIRQVLTPGLEVRVCQEETHALQQTCLQSITLSARRWNDGGIVRPNALAVQTLITNSNFVGCVIGKSAGLEPFRIRPA